MATIYDMITQVFELVYNYLLQTFLKLLGKNSPDQKYPLSSSVKIVEPF